MNITLEMLDRRIAVKMADRLNTAPSDFLRDNIRWPGMLPFRITPNSERFLQVLRAPTQEETNARLQRLEKSRLQRKRRFFPLLCTAFSLPIDVWFAVLAEHASGTALFSFLPMPHQTVPLFAFCASGYAAGLLGKIYIQHSVPSLENALTREELRCVVPLLTLTRCERAYCDNLVLISSLNTDQSTVTDALQHMQRLLDADRLLEERRRALMPILGSNHLSGIQAEIDQKASLLQSTSSTIAMQACQQSLTLLYKRKENAEALQQNLDQIKTQQETLLQTMQTMGSTLARLHLAPLGTDNPAVQEVTDTIEEMNRYTTAVEQAVQEVLSMGLSQ